MRQQVISHTIFCISLFVLGPIAWILTRGALAVDGGQGSTAMLSASVVSAWLRVLAAALIAGVAGVVAGKIVSPKGGLFNAGAVLAWAATGMGTVAAVGRLKISGMYTSMALEAAVLAAVAGGIAFAIHTIAHRGGGGKKPDTDGPAPMAALGLALLIGVAASAAGVWVGAQNMLKGQAIGAALIAGIAAGAAAFIVDRRVPVYVPILAVMLTGVAGLLYVSSTANAADHAVSGTIAAWGRLTPVDYLAGSFLGVPIGLNFGHWISGWAHHTAEAHASR